MVAIQGRTQSGDDQPQDWAVGSGWVHHLSGKPHCNNRVTAGFGLEHTYTQTYGLAVGIFDNSNCRTSTYAALSYRPLRLGNWHIGGIGGLVTGYNKTVLPAAGAVASYERKRWGFNVLYLPPIGKESGGVL